MVKEQIHGTKKVGPILTYMILNPIISLIFKVKMVKVSPLLQPTATPTFVLNSFDDYQFYEKDITTLVNWAGNGLGVI
jgi:hypothetical protein